MTRPAIVGLWLALAALLLAWALWAPPVQAATCAKASYYGIESGTRTANGEPFNGKSLTAAHRSLPFGTKLRVSYNGKSVVVRINDRGPAAWTKRSLDLSKEAARRLGMIHVGVARVCYARL